MRNMENPIAMENPLKNMYMLHPMVVGIPGRLDDPMPGTRIAKVLREKICSRRKAARIQ